MIEGFSITEISGDLVNLRELFKEITFNKEKLKAVIITEGRTLKKISFILDNPSDTPTEDHPKTFEL